MAVPKVVVPPKVAAPPNVIVPPKVAAPSKVVASSHDVAPPKAKSKSKSVQNRHINARSAYMYQAAAYLSSRVAEAKETRVSSHGLPTGNLELNDEQLLTPDQHPTTPSLDISTGTLPGSARHLVNQMRGVSRKAHTCLTKEIKRSICKRCDTLLVPTKTCKGRTENASKGGKKPWANVYVVTCLVCGTAKRFPTGMERQKKKSHRAGVVVDHAADVTMEISAGK